jgi:hypothetical protein
MNKRHRHICPQIRVHPLSTTQNDQSAASQRAGVCFVLMLTMSPQGMAARCLDYCENFSQPWQHYDDVSLPSEAVGESSRAR